MDITPRFTEMEFDATLAPVRNRLSTLTAENEALRAQFTAPRSAQPEETRS